VVHIYLPIANILQDTEHDMTMRNCLPMLSVLPHEQVMHLTDSVLYWVSTCSRSNAAILSVEVMYVRQIHIYIYPA